MDVISVISNKQSIFSSQIHTLSFPINWPLLVSTALSNYTLKNLMNLRANTIQINISPKHFLKSATRDETGSVTHINKTYLV